MQTQARPSRNGTHPGNLTDYVKTVQRLIPPLSGWAINVKADVSGFDSSDSWATMETSTVEREATLSFSPDLLRESPGKIRNVILHELAHVLFQPAMDTATHLAKPLGIVAWGIWWPGYEHAMEQVVTAFAAALAPHIPLPPKGLGYA